MSRGVSEVYPGPGFLGLSGVYQGLIQGVSAAVNGVYLGVLKIQQVAKAQSAPYF